MEVVKQNSNAIESEFEEFEKDGEIIIEAFKQSGKGLEFASE